MFLPCCLGMRLVGHVAWDSVTMDIPMRMMSSVAIVMAREKSGTSWELWRLLTRLVWEVRKRREEESERGGKGGRREGREEERERGGKGGKREGREEKREGGEKGGRRKGGGKGGMREGKEEGRRGERKEGRE